jgi:hypothetical protein
MLIIFLWALIIYGLQEQDEEAGEEKSRRNDKAQRERSRENKLGKSESERTSETDE